MLPNKLVVSKLTMRNTAALVILLVFECSVAVGKNHNSIPELLFNGNQYLKYMPSKSSDENSNTNKIEFEFRTVYPSGTLVILTGKHVRWNGHGNIMTVSLLRGYLRYSNMEYIYTYIFYI